MATRKSNKISAREINIPRPSQIENTNPRYLWRMGAVLVIATLALQACLLKPFNEVNSHPDIPLDKGINNTSASEKPPLDKNGKPEDNYFIGLALSGGGSRAANFSAAVMLKLHELGILEHVQYISSVSGGSLPAAYYALYQNDEQKWKKTPEEMEKTLKDVFSQNFEEWAVNYQVRSPARWVKQLASSYDRTDIMAEVFEDLLYADAMKFSNLPAKPRLFINATNYVLGNDSFTFTNENFNKLHANLSELTIGKAVASSAAFPGLLRTSTFADYTTHCRDKDNESSKCEDKKKYLHLFDGGVTDNLGIDSLLRVHGKLVEEKYCTKNKECEISGKRTASSKKKDIFQKGCLIIAVDAYSPYDNQFDADRPDTRKWNDLFFIDVNNTLNAFNILLQTKRRKNHESLGFDRAHFEHAVEGIRPIGFLDNLKTELVSKNPAKTYDVRLAIQEKRADCKLWHISFTQLQHWKLKGLAGKGKKIMDGKEVTSKICSEYNTQGIEIEDKLCVNYNNQLDERYKGMFSDYLEKNQTLEKELKQLRKYDLEEYASLLNKIDTRFRISSMDQELLYMAAHLLVNEKTSKETICQWVQKTTGHECKH